MFFHHPRKKYCHNFDMMDMDDMMHSTLFKVVAVGALVYVGAKAVHRMMED